METFHVPFHVLASLTQQVVVLAVFEELSSRQCEIAHEHKKNEKVREKLCAGGAAEASNLIGHLTNQQTKDNSFLGKKGHYAGIHTGSGFPKGTPVEVVLHPED